MRTHVMMGALVCLVLQLSLATNVAAQNDNEKVQAVIRLLAQATQMSQAGDHEGAVQNLTNAVQQLPNNGVLWGRLADLELLAGKTSTDSMKAKQFYRDAISHYKKAIEIKPGVESYSSGLREAYARSGDNTAASIRDATGAVQSSGSGGCISGIVLDRQGKPEARAVSFVLLGSDFSRGTGSDSEGRYRECGLPFGEYEVSLWSGGEPDAVVRTRLTADAPDGSASFDLREVYRVRPPVISNAEELRAEVNRMTGIVQGLPHPANVKRADSCPPMKGQLTRERAAACLSSTESLSRIVYGSFPLSEPGHGTAPEFNNTEVSSACGTLRSSSQLAVALEQKGLLKLHEHPVSWTEPFSNGIHTFMEKRDATFCHVILTPEGARRAREWAFQPSGVKGPDNNRAGPGDYAWLGTLHGALSVRLGQAQLVAVTGILGSSEVEFTWRTTITDLGRLVPQAPGMNDGAPRQGRATFSLYDDGWRLAGIALY